MNLILIHSLGFVVLWKAGFFGKIIDELDIAERKVIRYIRSLEIQQIDLSVQKNNIIFLGDSFISNLNVSAIHPLAVNFGIGGNTTEDVLYKVKDYKSLKKVKSVFLNVGINDLLRGKPADEVHSNIKKIIRLINGRVFLGSIHPLDERVKRAKRTNNREISELNSRMASFCRAEPNCFFVDVFSYLVDGTGNLDSQYHTDDGFHLSPAGYEVWMTQMKGALQPEHYKDHPFTHNSPVTGIQGSASLQGDGKFPNPLHAGPEGLGAGMTVAFAAKKAAEAGDQAHHLAQARRGSRWRRAMSHDPGGLPFLGSEHHLAGQVRAIPAPGH